MNQSNLERPKTSQRFNWKEKFLAIRKQTRDLCKNLKPEDTVVQPIEDVSPAKWHLAHTTWFFEKFILMEYGRAYQAFDERYNYLFNSYYNSQGNRVSRSLRGYQTRPGFREVLDYRDYVDDHLTSFLDGNDLDDEIQRLLWVGIQHEQQHQELLITDMKYILSLNHLNSPLLDTPLLQSQISDEGWIPIPEGVVTIGNDGQRRCFDNERPRHPRYQNAAVVRAQPVLVREYLQFMEDGGYDDPLLWLSDGWAWRQDQQVEHPLYWKKEKVGWQWFTTAGWKELNPDAPVAHISYYEANAYAQWAGCRLCTEGERELADPQIRGNQCWEWTQSAYLPYPGYQTWPGALGEYNGKFMVNQMVLRGGSVATPAQHYRSTYRNFFHPDKQWQFSGIRLARDN